jgi:pimeloyl-ACP methyl ester carboxylesterase
MEPVEYIDVDGIKIAYRSNGDGKPLVFLHGITYSSYSFRHNIPILSKFSRIICPDLVGHGKSDKPCRFDYRLKNQAAVIRKFCTKLGLAKIDLGGCSMGGALAMQFALTYPDIVDRLILVDSAGIDDDVKASAKSLGIPILGYIFALNTARCFIRGIRSRMISDEDRNGEYDEYMNELGSLSSLLAGMRNLRANRTFRIDGIERITQKTLIVWGENDMLFSLDTARMMAKSIPNSRLILLPDTGHLPNEEKPADFNQVVVDFLLERIPWPMDREQYHE